MNYKVGIVGCGRIGCELDDCHVNAYSTVPGIRLVAVADKDEERLHRCIMQKGLESTEKYLDYEKLMEDEAIDILSICTLSNLHYEITKKAVKCGVKAIYCEKPIADNLADARRMVELCAKHGVVLQIDHKHRFSTMHQEKRNYIHGGGLGVVRDVSFYYTRGIANSGSHMFDFLRFLFGDILEVVTAEESIYDSHIPFDPNLDGELKFVNGVTCSIHSCAEPVFKMDIVGTNGQMSILVNDYYNPSTDLLVLGVKHLVGCLECKEESMSDGWDGYKALEAIVAFRKANAIKRPVKLPIAERDEAYTEMVGSL